MTKADSVALIPAYEPEERLCEIVKRLCAAGLRVVVVDDGSGGGYQPVFSEVCAHADLLTHAQNRGKGAALRTGLQYIRQTFGEACTVVTLDADGQHRIDDVLRVLARAQECPGTLVLGSRSFDGDVPARSRFGNTVTRAVYRLSTGLRVRDTQTGLRAFSGGLIPMMLAIGGDRYEYEMNVLLQCAQKKIPIREETIQTVYFDNNARSHFSTFRDSARVYANILKFAASSLLGFAVDYGLYSLLTLLTAGLGTAFSVTFSNITARVVSAGVNFAVNRRLVFRSRESVVKTGAQYFALAALILCGNTLLLNWMVEALGVNRYAAKLVTELTFFVLSWAAQRFLIFRRRPSADADPDKEVRR